MEPHGSAEDTGDPDVPVYPRPHPRRLGDWPTAVVLTGMVLGLGIVAADRFRPGTIVFALSVLVAAVLRATLPERTAGLLVVRSRSLDVLVLGLLGAGLTVLALAVPPPT
jgi:hypothetical protein